ncbi:hypothetical protein SAMN05444521_8204 [Streptomyces sp. 3214.6]|nr:hypothetical protein SAMN05444521_8204 [Streptomyces sp. 3214.6]
MQACHPGRSRIDERAMSIGTPLLPQGWHEALQARPDGAVLKPTGGKVAGRT